MPIYEVTLSGSGVGPSGPRPQWQGGPQGPQGVVLIEADNLVYEVNAGTLIAVNFVREGLTVAAFNANVFVSAVVVGGPPVLRSAPPP